MDVGRKTQATLLEKGCDVGTFGTIAGGWRKIRFLIFLLVTKVLIKHVSFLIFPFPATIKASRQASCFLSSNYR